MNLVRPAMGTFLSIFSCYFNIMLMTIVLHLENVATKIFIFSCFFSKGQWSETTFISPFPSAFYTTS